MKDSLRNADTHDTYASTELELTQASCTIDVCVRKPWSFRHETATCPLVNAGAGSVDTFDQSGSRPTLFRGQYLTTALPTMLSTGNGPQTCES